MKAILEFNLDEPEERKAHLRCVRSLDLVLALNNIEEYFRRIHKNDIFPGIDEVRRDIYNILQNLNVDLEELS